MTANARLIKAREGSYFAMGYFNSGTGLFTDLMYLVGLVAGGLFLYYGRIDFGEFTAYILFINNFLKPINRIISFFEQFINGMTGFRRFQDIMAQQPEPEDPNAVKYDTLTFDKALSDGLKIMDSTAFALCKDNNMRIIVFDMNKPGNLDRLIEGENIGTVVE